MVKAVNKDTKKCGAFENEFTFTLPKGMPQGVYPIKTAVIINGVESTQVDSRMQLVYFGDSETETYRIAKAD